MVLMIQEDISYSIAIRHFANSLIGNIQKIDDEKNALGLQYIDQLVYKLVDELSTTQRKLDTLSKTIIEQGVSFAENELIKYEEEYKLACFDAIKFLHERKSELQRFQNKFEGLINEILTLGKRSLFAFVTESRSKKNSRVEELGVGVPTFPKIASILRLHELEQGSLLNTAQSYLNYQAAYNQEAYLSEIDELQEEGASTTSVLNNFYDRAEAGIRDEMVQLAYESISPILLDNESKRTFLTSTIPKIAQNFLEKHENHLKEYYKESLEKA